MEFRFRTTLVPQKLCDYSACFAQQRKILVKHSGTSCAILTHPLTAQTISNLKSPVSRQ